MSQLNKKKVSTKVVAPYGLGVSGNGNVAR
jgi:hypothetical protein